MKVEVINLYSAKSRQQAVDHELKPLGIEYNYFEASRNCCPFGYGRLTEDDLQYMSKFKSVFGKHSTMTPGEVGCASSHVRILHDFVDSGADWICILEDDIQIARPSAFKAIVEEHHNILSSMDFIYLGAYRRTIPSKKTKLLSSRFKAAFRALRHIHLLWQSPNSSIDYHFQSIRETAGSARRLNDEWSLAGIHDGSHAYVLNQQAAKEIIKWNGNLSFRADEILSFLCYSKSIRMAIPVNPIVLQDLSLPSQIGNHPKSRSL